MRPLKARSIQAPGESMLYNGDVNYVPNSVMALALDKLFVASNVKKWEGTNLPHE